MPRPSLTDYQLARHEAGHALAAEAMGGAWTACGRVDGDEWGCYFTLPTRHLARSGPIAAAAGALAVNRECRDAHDVAAAGGGSDLPNGAGLEWAIDYARALVRQLEPAIEALAYRILAAPGQWLAATSGALVN